MKTWLSKSTIAFIILAFLLPLSAFCQDITGIWRGYFTTESGDQYKYELQIDQSKKNSISGVSYSYLDTRFYGKATLSGSYIKANKTALVQEVKTVEVKMVGGSFTCIMKCLFTYSVSGKEEFLDGTFSSMYEKSDAGFGIKRGGDCGGGSVHLRKVTTSDFYVEPFLRDKIKPINIDTVETKPTTKKPETTTTKPTPAKAQKKPVAKTTSTKKPISKTNTVAKKTTTPKKPVTTTTKQSTVSSKPRKDSIQRTIAPIVVEKPIEHPKINIPITTRSRQNELVQTLTVTNDEINVRLYDNGEIDGDTISVYLDGKLLVMNKMLSKVPITVTLKMDETNSEHTLVMVAENMGRIPPNTSLMIVQDGDKRYQVSITSTEQKNAMVRFRYQKK